MKSTIVSLIGCLIIISSYGQIPLSTMLENYMDAQAEVNQFSGAVLVSKNDSILLKKAYGFADYEWGIKNSIDTKFSLASVSKQFTAVAILQLNESHKLSLDDKLSKYYPDYPNGDLITLKMLLTHTSGVTEDVEELFDSNARVSRDSVINYLNQRTPLFKAGMKTQYSNIGFYLLATIVEKVSKKKFSNYMKENIFERAEMKNSGISSMDSIFSKMARVYQFKDDVLIKSPESNWDLSIGLDGVYSTIEDLYSWNKHLFEGASLISEKSKELMFTPYNNDVFGYGVLINPFYNHGHNLIGHDGGYFGVQTSLNKFVDDNVFITILSNNGSPSYLLAYGLSAIVFGKQVELPYEHIAITMDPDNYDDYVGEYDGLKIHKFDDKLLYSDYDIELIPESKTKFYRKDNDDRTFEFVRDKNGVVSHVIISKAGVQEIKKRK